MKNFLIFLFLFLIFNPLRICADENIFYDVPENFWGYKFIKQAYEEDVLKGMGKEPATGKIIFRPNDDLTTAQFVTFIGRIYYFEEMEEFKKVSEKWYDPAFKLVKTHDLLQNTTLANSFHGKLNRYEFVRILYNLMKDAQYPLPTATQLNEIYADIGDIEKVRKDGYEKEVAIAMYYKLISGMDDKGTFRGNIPLSRAQLAVFYVKSNEFQKKILQLTDKQKKEQKRTDKITSKMNKDAVEVFHLINDERKKAGLNVLRIDDDIQGLAEERARELLECFSHERPDKRSCFSIFDDHKIDYSECGENIAAGQRSPKEVVKAWMDSPPHRQNILDPDFTHTGIGHVLGSHSEYPVYWVQIFWKK